MFRMSVFRWSSPFGDKDMYENAESRAGLVTEHRSPVHRVIMLAKTGAVSTVMRLSAADDDQAIEHAKMMVDGHAVELRDGLRFIDHFAPVE